MLGGWRDERGEKMLRNSDELVTILSLLTKNLQDSDDRLKELSTELKLLGKETRKGFADIQANFSQQVKVLEAESQRLNLKYSTIEKVETILDDLVTEIQKLKDQIDDHDRVIQNVTEEKKQRIEMQRGITKNIYQWIVMGVFFLCLLGLFTYTQTIFESDKRLREEVERITPKLSPE